MNLENFTSFKIDNSTEFKCQLLGWANLFSTFVWLDSNQIPDKYGQYDFLLGIDSIENFSQLNEITFSSNLESNRFVFGYLGYHFYSNSKLQSSLDFPKNHLFAARYVLIGKNGRIYINQNYPESFEIWELIKKMPTRLDASFQKINFAPTTSKEEYLRNVRNIKEDIENGSFYELNYCINWEGKFEQIDPIECYLGLSSKANQPMSGIYKNNSNYIICLSPERFLMHKNGNLVSQPIKGTTKRDLSNPKNDISLKNQLENSIKERAENLIITDMCRNDLTKYSIPNTVKVEELCKVYSYSQVHQMISTITASISPTNSLKALESAIPAASMTGSPKKSSILHIEKYENFFRGPYAGNLGYIAPNSDFDFNVIIRSLYICSNKKIATMATGGAITIQSHPEYEYEECMTKAKFILDYFQ